MVIFHSYVSLPEGKPPFSYGFRMFYRGVIDGSSPVPLHQPTKLSHSSVAAILVQANKVLKCHDNEHGYK